MASFLSHFGLSRHPFNKDLLDADLWQPPSQADLVEEAVEALRSRESLLLYGECGVGKTCTLRLVRHRISSDGFRLTYCHHAFLGRRDSKGLKAHHSPDLFHVQHEVCHALCAVLATQVRQAEAAQDKATGALEARRLQEQAWPQQPHGPGRPPNLAGRVAVAQQDAAIAEQEVAAARDRQERARGAVQGLAHAYHPVEFHSGALRSAAQVESELQAHFATLRAVATEAAVPQRCHQGIEKAARVVPAMVATLTFFHSQCQQRIAALALPHHEAFVLTRFSGASSEVQGALSRSIRAESSQSAAISWSRPCLVMARSSEAPRGNRHSPVADE